MDDSLDLKYIYKQLKDKFDLELTSGLALVAAFMDGTLHGRESL